MRPCGTETILVVDDDDTLRRVTARVLAAHGYRVLEARGGEAALLIAETHPDIALMLTDVIMPGLSGSALVTRLQVLNPSLKAIFTSGHTNDEIVQHGVLEPGVHFLQKPVSMAALVRQVRAVLDLPAT